MLEARLQIAREETKLLHSDDIYSKPMAQPIGIYEKIIALALDHLTQVFIHEHAFRDVLDEMGTREKDVLAEYGHKAVREFRAMKRAYDGELLPLLQKLSPEALAVTLEQMVRVRESAVEHHASL